VRILFIGCVQFSGKILEKLFQMNANIVGVCTKKESSFNSDFLDLSILCQKKKTPCFSTLNINSKETYSWIKNSNPDIIFCFGWSSLIQKKLLHLPPMGTLGFHPTLLPQNRGRHPLIWPLFLGLKKSASTFFFMREGADNGPILSQKIFDILEEDDALSLYNKVIEVALLQVESFIPKLENKTFTLTNQEESKTNKWRKRSFVDGSIDFRMNSLTIHNLVRSITHPYVGAHLQYNDSLIKVWKTKVSQCTKKNIEPGKILKIEDSAILVKTYDSALWLLKHEFEKMPRVGEYL